MGIKDFFRKIGHGLKNVGSKIWNGIKKVGGFVGKIAKPLIGIAKPILGGMSLLPGKAGMIGAIGGTAASAAEAIINKLENPEVKGRLTNLVSKETAQAAADAVHKKPPAVVEQPLNPTLPSSHPSLNPTPLLANTLNPSQRSIALSQMNPPHMM